MATGQLKVFEQALDFAPGGTRSKSNDQNENGQTERVRQVGPEADHRQQFGVGDPNCRAVCSAIFENCGIHEISVGSLIFPLSPRRFHTVEPPVDWLPNLFAADNATAGCGAGASPHERCNTASMLASNWRSTRSRENRSRTKARPSAAAARHRSIC